MSAHDDLLTLAAKATPGPWEHEPYTDKVFKRHVWDHNETIACTGDCPADAEFIAACSPERITALLEENRRLREKAPTCKTCRFWRYAPLAGPFGQCEVWGYQESREKNLSSSFSCGFHKPAPEDTP